ncbi:MAG: spore coat protein CotH [Arcticibacterium sp.]
MEGVLIFEGDTLSPVGIRYKGSIGAWVGCLSGDHVFEPSGFKTCTKLSMKVNLNSDQKFFNLKKLQFHSQNQDPSQMREKLCYWLFREMGIPALRSVHAKLVIYNKYRGLFALTEQVDKRFTKENFHEDKDITFTSKSGH